MVESSGGDDTIELFEAKKPRVVVLTATLELGDTGSLRETMLGAVLGLYCFIGFGHETLRLVGLDAFAAG